MSENDSKVTIKLLFFAKAREITGINETLAEVSRDIKGTDLLDYVSEKFNLACIRKNVILALNENWVDLNLPLKLKNSDEVAVIPPLSGENVNVVVLSVGIQSTISCGLPKEYGAVSIFVGTTRNSFEGKIVEKLEYEAYDSMAIKSLEGICNKIRQKFEIGNITIVHRLGDVPVQEASVVIAISATHRKSVFEALSFAIDSLKADVPIWKKEVYQGDASAEWKENSECAWSMNDLTSYIANSSDCIQLQEEVVEAESVDQVSPDLIQINTNLQEINRRIASFMDRKRQQVNMSNVDDFCIRTCDDDNSPTCARTNAALFRRKDSKTHLKVHRVENMTGPQIKSSQFHIKTQPESGTEPGMCPAGAEERLMNAEYFLNIKNDSLNVFSRLKAIEDKILYLESISPEYFDFVRQVKPVNKNPFDQTTKKIYSSEDIDVKLNHLKSKFLKR